MIPSLRFLGFGLTAALGPILLSAEETAVAPEDDTPDVQGYFLSRLVTIESMATGVHELSKQEQANLENLIAYEVHSAQAGGVSGFGGTFSSRRTAEELQATGLDRMEDDQRGRLDQHIAGFIADQSVPFVYQGERLGGRSNRSYGDGTDFKGKGPLLEVHGSVTLEVGTSSRGTYYGGSATAIISDPKGRFNAIISYGTAKGNLPYYYDDYYYRRGPYRRGLGR